MTKMTSKPVKKMYEEAYRKADNKTLLSDYKGMREGKYYAGGQGEARREIERRKKAGLMKKSALKPKTPSYNQKWDSMFG